jgi:isocitrate/isopropylmalate dehydrogenase
MLDHLAERAAAERLQQAVQRVYAEKRRLTPDVGGAASTAEFTSAVIDALGRQAHSECVVRVNGESGSPSP